MRCMVPRMAQVRTTDRSAVRASLTHLAVSPDVRTRMDRTPATGSCAWTPHRSATTCRTPTCCPGVQALGAEAQTTRLRPGQVRDQPYSLAMAARAVSRYASAPAVSHWGKPVLTSRAPFSM